MAQCFEDTEVMKQLATSYDSGTILCNSYEPAMSYERPPMNLPNFFQLFEEHKSTWELVWNELLVKIRHSVIMKRDMKRTSHVPTDISYD